MTEEYEAYASKYYLPALDANDPDLFILLAAVRFVETRRLEGYESRLQEILTTRYPGKIAREIEAAAVDAILATMEDPIPTASFMALAATRDLAAARLCEQALEQLGPTSLQALLTELTQSHPGARLRKLARLLHKISKVPSPEPITFWGKADRDQRTATVTRWESQIRLAGKL